MRKLIIPIMVTMICATFLAGCGNASTGPAFADKGTDRKAFVEQKKETVGAPDLPGAAPIGSTELNKLLEEAKAQKDKNIAEGATVAGQVDGFKPGALDTSGMKTTPPSNSGIKLPDNWQTPTINSEGEGPNMNDIDKAFEDKKNATTSGASSSSSASSTTSSVASGSTSK